MSNKFNVRLFTAITFALAAALVLALILWFTDEMASAYRSSGHSDVGLLLLSGVLSSFCIAMLAAFLLLEITLTALAAQRVSPLFASVFGAVLASIAALFYLTNLSWFPELFSRVGVLYLLVLGLAGLILSWLYVRFRDWQIRTKSTATAALQMLAMVAIVATCTLLANSKRQAALDAETNVVIILIDALRSDHLGAYGYDLDTSPNLDEFARESVVFKNSFSQSTHTKPSTASLFTSLYPSQHGVMRGNHRDAQGNFFSDVLDEDFKTMAEYLTEAGFDCAGFLDQGQLHDYMGFSQGFTYYNSYLRQAEQINKEFFRWLPANKHRKFFAYLHYLDVHAPYAPPPEYRDLFMNGKSSLVVPEQVADWRKFKKKFDKMKDRLGPEDFDQLRALYDAEIRAMDDDLAVLFNRMKKEGVYDNSLIIITADHGDSFMEHGEIDHGTTLYEEVLRVPLIVRFPGAAHTGVIDTPVQSIDVLPTILDYLKIEKGNALLMGESVLSFIDKPESGRKNPIFSERMHLLSIRKGDYKLIYNRNLEYAELYDLAKDPGEQNNLFEDSGRLALAEALKRELLEWSTGIQEIKPAGTGVRLDTKTIEKLKSLGYIK